ncbi:hypothetical protein Scep_020414 [Stephania cephalantha]|uniref:Uncharacterized protein n=1 Tax=Stephania cephalantha TaxID=152367 RepID=A0AAP0ICS5_9MAGN
MRSNISSASLFGEADVWWRSMVARNGKPKDWTNSMRGSIRSISLPWSGT